LTLIGAAAPSHARREEPGVTIVTPGLR
jgi:hypothetical protein